MVPAGKQLLKRVAKFEPAKYKQNVAHSWITAWSLLLYMEEFNTENSIVLQQTWCTGLKTKCVAFFLADSFQILFFELLKYELLC